MPALSAVKQLLKRAHLMMVGLTAAAVVGAIAYEMNRRAEELGRQRGRYASFKEDTEIVISALEAQLQNPESCTAMMGGLPLRPGGETPLRLNWTYDPDPDFAGPLEEEKEITAGMVVKRITLDPIDLNETPPTDPATGSDMNTQISDDEGKLRTFTRYPSRLHISFAAVEDALVTANRAHNGSGLDMGLPVLVWADSENKISACFGKNSAGALCNAMGGFYVADPAGRIPPNLRCRQSVYTRQFINGAFASTGACRNAGYVTDPSLCAKRFSSDTFTYGAIKIQDSFRGLTEGFLCLTCK